MSGLEGRTSLLVNLARAMKGGPKFFGEDGRPGNMIGKLPCSCPLASPQKLKS